MAGIHFDVTADNRDFMNRLNEVQGKVRTLVTAVEQGGGEVDAVFGQMGNALKKLGAIAGTAFTLDAMKDFAAQCIKVRGEIQALETSFTTLLGSRSKADALIGEIRQFAATTPMDVGTLAKGAQTMLGFNIELEEVMPMMKAIGDISMGDAQKFGALTLAFSQASATGKLMGQDLLQMINAGFNPLVQMGEKAGKSISQLKDDMSKGKISIQMLTDAFLDATSEGGQFNGMLEAQSQTLQGAFSNLSGAYEDMLNELGEKAQGVVVDAVNTLMSMVQNYEQTARTIAELVALYGTYKAALVTLTAIQSARATMQAGWTLAELAHFNALVLVEKAQKLLNATILKNPYMIAAVAVASLVGWVYKLAAAETDAEKAHRRLAEAEAKVSDELAQEQYNIEKLFETLRNAKKGSEEYKTAKDLLLSQYGEYLKGLVDEKNELTDLEAAYYRVSAAARESANARAMGEATKNAQNDYDNTHKDVISNIQSVLRGVDNDNLRNTLTQLVMRDLAKGSLSAEVQNMVGDALGEKRLNNSNWAADSKVVDIKKQFTLERNALELRNNSIKEAEATFTTYANSYNDKTDEELTKLRDSIQHHINDTKGLEEGVEVYSGGELFKRYENAADAMLELQQIEVELQRREKAAEAGKAKGNETIELTESERKKLAAAAAKRAKAEKQNAKELQDLIIANDEAEIELRSRGTEKKIKQLEIDHQKELIALDRQADEMKAKNVEAGGKNELTSDQQAALDKSRELAEESHRKQLADIYRADLESMQTYLSEYGTFQQKKLAIAELYAEKIRRAESEGDTTEVKRLERERNAKIGAVDSSALKADIDWALVFGNFGSMFNEMLAPQLDKLKEYTKTDEFKNADASDQQAITETISKLQDQLGATNATSFGELGRAVKECQMAMQATADAESDLATKTKAVNEAQKAYNAALASGSKEQIAGTKADLDFAKAQMEMAQTAVDAAQEHSEAAKVTVTNAATTLGTAINQVVSGLQGLASGSISGAAEGLENLGNGMKGIKGLDKAGDTISKLASSLNGTIVGLVLSILDILKDGISPLVIGIIDSILGAIGGILSDVLSGDLFVNIGKSLKDGIGGILNAITWGGFNSWFGTSGNTKEVNELTEKLTESNDRLRESVDALKDEITEASGWRAIDAAKQAESAQQQINEQALEVLMAQMGYHGAHHSNAYYWNLSDDIYRSLNDTLADYAARNNKDRKHVYSLEDLYALTPEEMAYIRDHNVEAWAIMLDQGKYDKSEYWESYAEQAGKLEEITKALNEALTQTTFESLRDSFVDTLMDMDASAEDFAANFREMLMRSVINARIDDLLSDELEEFYNTWAEMAKDGGLDKTEIGSLKDWYDRIVAQGQQIRDEAAAITGYTGASTYSQTASRGWSTELSEGTGQELNGRFTAIQEVAYQISDTQREHIAKVDGLITLAAMRNTYLDSIENNVGLANVHLAAIAKNTGELVGIRETINDIQRKIKTL